MLQPGRLWRPIGLALSLVGLVALVWWLVSPRAALLVAIVAPVVVLVAASVLVGPARLVARDTAGAHLLPEQRASAVNSARTTLVQGIVGLAALAGIFVAWQQLQTDREQSRTDREQLREQLTLTRQGQVADRFTRAVDQLGSAKLEQRLGGIYALERIAKESPDGDDRLVVAEVLTAYVRQHAPPDRKPVSAQLLPLKARAPDVQAAMTVLGRRTVVATDPPIELNNVDLRMADLHSVRLQQAILIRAQLEDANLDQAQLQGAYLSGAQLQGAILTYAQLQGAYLNGARLDDAILSDAKLQGANLSNAQLQGAILDSAQLQEARLNGAQLQGAYLNGAQLQRANLLAADLQNANLEAAELQEANLARAQLQASNLDGAHLQGATCDNETRWPDGFDWKAAGVELRKPALVEVRP
jgi:uncharacterized protein YjbI with pentapeptide repeats